MAQQQHKYMLMFGLCHLAIRSPFADHTPSPPAPAHPLAQVETAVALLGARLPGRRSRYSCLPYDEWTEPGPHGSPAGDFTATSPAPDRRGAATFLGYQALPAAAPPAPPQEEA